MSSRDQFIQDLADWSKERADITLRGKFKGIEPTEEFPLREPHPLHESGYEQGYYDALSIMLSITDSRELNGAKYRLTDIDGEVITFYPDDREPGNLDAPGIIVAVWNKVSS